MPDPTRDFAATTFVVDNHQTLLLWHRKLQAWLPPGGHIEANELPEEAAVREVREETGLDVELLGKTTHWGTVQVLRTPVCVLLERIGSAHQHIDLIYFGRVTGGELRIDPLSADRSCWYAAAELDDPQIAQDIRILGCQAIEAVAAQKNG